MYDIVASGPERRFEITGGLQEGYDDRGALHTIQDVDNAHAEYQTLMCLSMGAMIEPTHISYGWPTGQSFRCASEIGFRVFGVLSVEHWRHTSNEDALDRVKELAELIAMRLGQLRVYFSFLGQAYILERQGAVLPTSP